ncbi:MAG: OmpA family protein [Rhodobacter sp.]|nr:OmpA family protein [Rhodobacter sp.]
MSLRAATLALAALAPMQAQALSLEFPAISSTVAEHSARKDSYFVPTGPFTEGPISGLTAEGAVVQQSWKVGGGSLTTLQILAPLREQLQSAGYQTIYECEARICGGFDFRYQIDILPEPDMHVNLGDFRYLAARRESDEGPEYAVLVVSRSANAGFVQLTRIGRSRPDPAMTTSTKTPAPQATLAPAGPIGDLLESHGHATLDDLYFQTGSSELGAQDFASLQSLAGYLAARPERRVVLVGHTDSQGALDRNVALSERRARAVRERLIQQYDVPLDQVDAKGVGYLAPRASNLTDEGRAQNRRVEVILTSTQ